MSSTFCSCCFFPSTYTTVSGWCNLVCVECLSMIKQNWSLVFVGVWCYSGRWVWILRALAHFKGTDRSPGLFQDFGGYIVKSFKTPHYSVSWTWCSGYDCRLSVGGIPSRNLWIANFQFSFYEICVQDQWGNKTLRFYLRARHLRSKFDYC